MLKFLLFTIVIFPVANAYGQFTSLNPFYFTLYSSVAWSDYNRDGHADVALCGLTGSSSITSIYRGNPDGTFTDIGAGLPGVGYGSINWVDYDCDGDLDLFYCGDAGEYQIVTKLYRNDGNNIFIEINTGILKLECDGNSAIVEVSDSVFAIIPYSSESEEVPPLFSTTIRSIIPNPFSDLAKISFSLSKSTSFSLTVYNLKGQNVTTLSTGKQTAGEFELLWDGSDKHGVRVSSGVYFLRLQTPTAVVIRKMLLLK